jgi:hypothetical protein
MHRWFLNFYPALIDKDKIKYEFFACFFDNTNSKGCSESRVKVLFRLSFALKAIFFRCNFIADLRNNFQDNIRLSEHFLES